MRPLQSYSVLHFTVIVLLTLSLCFADDDEDDVPQDDPHRDPSLCEVCKYLATELQGRLDETGKTNEVLETGYQLDGKKKRKEYRKSELRFIEAVNEPHVCEKILEYNIHAERKGSLRFAKGRSQTMETLHNLVDKGVNVELGIPYDMWDTPSAGVTEMHRKCFQMVENFEDDMEDWYWNQQDVDLMTYLCKDRVLRKDDQECLAEYWSGEKKKKEKEKQKDKKNLKGDDGTRNDDTERDEL